MKKLLYIVLLTYSLGLFSQNEADFRNGLGLPQANVLTAADPTDYVVLFNTNKKSNDLILVSDLFNVSIPDNQITVGTGAGIEGDSNLTWSGTQMLLENTQSVVNPAIQIGTNGRDVSTWGQAVTSAMLLDDVNFNAFADMNLINRSTNTTDGYGSFDTSVRLIGDNPLGHYYGYQSRLRYASTASMPSGNIFNSLTSFVSYNVVEKGVVPNACGMLYYDIIGSGTVENQYGVYIKALNKGTVSNYGIYSLNNNYLKEVVTENLTIPTGNPQNGKVLTSDASGNATWQDLPSVAPETTLLQPKVYATSSYVDAIANTNDNVADAFLLSDGTYLNSGRITFTGHPYTVGSWYYLDQSSAGAVTSTKPTTGLVQQLFFVEDANTLLVNIEPVLSNTTSGFPDPIFTSIKPNVFNQNVTSNVEIKGSYFTTNNSSLSISNYTINSYSVVDDNTIQANITSNSTDGFYDLSISNIAGSVTETNAVETRTSTWVDLRLGGDAFTDGNAAGNAIRYRAGMGMSRDANGMFFTGSNPWSSWVKFENLAWNRGDNKTLQWIFTKPTNTMMIGIGSDVTDETNTAQYQQAETEAYFQNSTTMWGYTVIMVM